MSNIPTDVLALVAFVVLVLLVGVIVGGGIYFCVALYDRRLHLLRQKRAKGEMVPIHPSVNRNPDRRPPESG